MGHSDSIRTGAHRGASNTKVLALSCLGCGLLVLISGIFAVKLGQYGSRKLLSGYVEQEHKSAMFLTLIQERQYSNARELMSPEGQQRISEKQFKSLVEGYEKRLGPMQSWSRIEVIAGQSSPESTTDLFNYRYRLRYQKGGAIAHITFRQTSPLKPSLMVDDFQIQAEGVKPAATPGTPKSSSEPARTSTL